MTLARRHYQRVSAAEASSSADAREPINASAYELQLAKLAEDKRRLKEVQSIERKIEVKRQLLPDYAPWIEGVLESGRGGQDAVLMTVMVWRIDAGDYVGALPIAAYALKHGLVMPDQYQRDVATLVTEEISDQALSAQGSGSVFPLQVLADVAELTRTFDMPDEVRAKLMKALGTEHARLVDQASGKASAIERAKAALDFLRRALQLHDRVGVKKDIERLERFLKNNPAESTAEPGAPGDPATGHPGAPAAETAG